MPLDPKRLAATGVALLLWAPALGAQTAPSAAQPVQPVQPAATAATAATANLDTGVRMHYETHGPADGPVVVLLHGYSDSGFSFSRVVPLLPRDWRIVVPDLRGHGRSSRPEAGYGMDELATDVLALLDTMGIESATVVGHSMGTLVAQRIAATAADRVEALVLVGGTSSIHRLPGLDEVRASVDALADPVPETFVRGFQESTLARDVPPAFMDRVVAESRRLPARVWRQVLRGMLEAPVVAPGELTAPTLLQWGSEDALFGRAAQEELLARLPSAGLRVYEGVGHAPHWEVPAAFAADLSAFVDRRSPGARSAD